MLLAGFLLSCLLQLPVTQLQETIAIVVHVIIQPANPQVGQDVTLSLQGGPRQFEQCQWKRGIQSQSSDIILTYFPKGDPKVKNGSAHSGRETVHQDCSLQIRRLTRRDMGTYFVSITTNPIVQQGDSSQQQEPDYVGGTFLQMSALFTGSNQINLTVTTLPKFPTPNQRVTLTPKGIPGQFFYCQWLRRTRFGTDELIYTYIAGRLHELRPPKREEIGKDCSLSISNLTTSDSGNYTMQLEAPFNQQQQPEKGTNQQENKDSQFYIAHVNLLVSEQSQTDPHKGGSSSLSYNGGLIALVLLGSFSWVDPLMPIFSLFFSPLASLKPRFRS